MPLTSLAYTFSFSNMSEKEMFNGHDRVRALARGLAKGLAIEQAAHAAGFSHSTALFIASSDAFKNLVAHEVASTRVSDILCTTTVGSMQ